MGRVMLFVDYRLRHVVGQLVKLHPIRRNRHFEIKFK